MPFSILSDSPIGCLQDFLQFNRYVDPLISIFADENAQTPFTIGVFGSWGSGKSTLLQMVDERLERDHAGKFIRVHFNPWLHRKEENMLVPLLHTLHDTLNEKRWERFKSSADKIGTVLLRLGGDFLLRHMTADAVSLEKLESLEEAWKKERGKVTSEIRKLHNTLQEEADKISGGGSKLIFFIDDLDRCEPDEIIALLESIKLFLDLKNVFILLAVDKEVIDRGIEVKYAKFKFARERKLALGAEYLEKMVQLPLQLFPLSSSQVRRFMEAFEPPGEIRAQLDLLERVVLPNPRKIKRILNILTVTTVMVSTTPALQSLKPELLARLAVLQVQSGELYGEIVRQPDLLLAFEGMYATPPKYSVEKPESFAEFGSRSDAVRNICSAFYRPDTFLAYVFHDAGFLQVNRADLAEYLSMMGA